MAFWTNFRLSNLEPVILSSTRSGNHYYTGWSCDRIIWFLVYFYWKSTFLSTVIIRVMLSTSVRVLKKGYNWGFDHVSLSNKYCNIKFYKQNHLNRMDMLLQLVSFLWICCCVKCLKGMWLKNAVYSLESKIAPLLEKIWCLAEDWCADYSDINIWSGPCCVFCDFCVYCTSNTNHANIQCICCFWNRRVPYGFALQETAFVNSISQWYPTAFITVRV